MMYKATLTFSLLFLAIAGSAQSDGGADPSEPPSNYSSVTSQVYPSSTPISNPPIASNGNSSHTNTTRPSGCHSHSATPTVHSLSGGVFSSVASGASTVSMHNSTCHPNYKSTIPTGTASVSSFSGSAYPTTNVSKPIHTIAPNGTYAGNSTHPTTSSKPFSSGTNKQKPSASTVTATTSYAGRRRLVRRQYL